MMMMMIIIIIIVAVPDAVLTTGAHLQSILFCIARKHRLSVDSDMTDGGEGALLLNGMADLVTLQKTMGYIMLAP